MAFDLK